MRLNHSQKTLIRQEATSLFGPGVEVILFGSRVEDDQRGGDIDIMIKSVDAVERPALMAARLSTRLSRLLDGRKVDVIIQSPSLKHLPIHAVAERNGIRL